MEPIHRDADVAVPFCHKGLTLSGLPSGYGAVTSVLWVFVTYIANSRKLRHEVKIYPTPDRPLSPTPWLLGLAGLSVIHDTFLVGMNDRS